MKKLNYTLTTRRASKPLFLQKLPNLVFARSGVDFFTVLFAENGKKNMNFWTSKVSRRTMLEVADGPDD